MTTYNIEDYIFTGDTSWPRIGEYYYVYRDNSVMLATHDHCVSRYPILLAKSQIDCTDSMPLIGNLVGRIKELEAELAAARSFGPAAC